MYIPAKLLSKPAAVSVYLRKGEETEKLIKRYLKKVKKEEIVKEVLKNQYFLTKSQKRRLKRLKNKFLRKTNKIV